MASTARVNKARKERQATYYLSCPFHRVTDDVHPHAVVLAGRGFDWHRGRTSLPEPGASAEGRAAREKSDPREVSQRAVGILLTFECNTEYVYERL